MNMKQNLLHKADHFVFERVKKLKNDVRQLK
jgi:hypothetical protein